MGTIGMCWPARDAGPEGVCTGAKRAFHGGKCTTPGEDVCVEEVTDNLTTTADVESSYSAYTPACFAAAKDLARIIDAPSVQALMDDFYALTDLPIGLIDLQDRVLVGTGWQDVCTKFHRVHPDTLACCEESDLKLTEGVERGEFRAYKCKNGMWDVVTPLFVGDAHVGNIFVGQFRYDDEEFDLDFFRQQAERYGFDVDAYVEAARSIPTFSREKVDALMRFYTRLAEQIAQVGFSNLVLSEAFDALERSEWRYRVLLDRSPVPHAIYDDAGSIGFVNAAFTETFGYAAGDVPTVSDWWRLAYPDPDYRAWAADEWQRRADKVERTGDKFEPLDVVIRSKDGTSRNVRASMVFMREGGTEEHLVVLYDITERIQAEEALLATNDRLEGVLKSITTTMGKVVEARDPYTQGHEQGVAKLSKQIAEEMGMAEDDVAAIEVSALVHDIGKLAVPAEILTKPGRISKTEFELIKVHSQAGHDILKDIDFAWPVADIVLQHHERLDGSGYPNGIVGDEMLMAARVIAVADVIEAMSAHRPYRAALGLDVAMAEITGHPERFDPEVVSAAVRLYERGSIEL